MVSTKTISRVYLILALLAGMLLSPLLYSAIALVLLLLQAFYIYKPFGTELKLTFTFFTLFIAPMTLQSVAGELLAALFVIPAIPFLDYNLRENASNHDLHPSEGRKPTALLRTLLIAIIVVLVVSLLLANWTLIFTSALLAAYLIAVLVYILYSIPKDPLQGSDVRVRIIAGDTSKVSLAIRSRSKLTLHTLLTSPHSWVDLDPARLMIGRDEVKLNIALTPPLSGPSKPQLQALMSDPWGFIQMNQNFEPVEMYVIPRAKYAEWLAKKFLGQATQQIALTAITASSSKVPIGASRGIEYLGSRFYKPGDRLKDMDWKHMCKLNELVVKEYSEAKGLFTIVAVNLVVKDAEEADKLAYNLITLALTLTKVAIPTALAAYNHQEVLLTTKVVGPREILKKTLKLQQDITLVEPAYRFLQLPDIRWLRRTMTQFEQAKTEPAQKIADFLRLESRAIQQRTINHPAVQALAQVTEHVHPPATIAVVSGWNHDAEALLATLDRLERQGYNTIDIMEQ